MDGGCSQWHLDSRCGLGLSGKPRRAAALPSAASFPFCGEDATPVGCPGDLSSGERHLAVRVFLTSPAFQLTGPPPGQPHSATGSRKGEMTLASPNAASSCPMRRTGSVLGVRQQTDTQNCAWTVGTSGREEDPAADSIFLLWLQRVGVSDSFNDHRNEPPGRTLGGRGLPRSDAP